MPLYEYKCQQCGLRYERLEHVSAIHDGICPTCGGNAHRLIGAPALKFKGTGWYITDYGKGNGSRPAETNAPPTDSSKSTKTEKKAETTPEKKTDSKVA